MGILLAFGLLIAFILMLWYLEGSVASKFSMGRNAGVKLIGPMYSISASGTIGNAFTFLVWKGIQYAREYFIPANPRTAKQVNIRTAMSLLVAKWHGIAQARKDVWKAAASGKKYTGMNLWISRGAKAYIAQLGIDVTPTDFNVPEDYPDDVWTWS